MPETAALTVREVRDDDEPAVLDLLTAALAGGPTRSRTADFLRWKHRDNPFGRSIGLVAEDAGTIVGVRLVMRWQFEHAGQPVTAARMVDTATHPAYQGRGIFRRLTMESLDIARADTDLIFNTPNASSRPGYLKMGWQPVGTVATSLRPVRPLRLVLGARAALARHEATARPLLDPPLPTAGEVLSTHAADVAALVAARHREPSRLQTASGPAYLRWRYADVPGLDYRAVPVLDGDRLVGLGIGRLRLRGGLHEFTLAEVLHGAEDGRAAGRVLRSAARRSGADHVATHVAAGSPTSRALLRSGYLTTGLIGLTLTTLPLRPIAVDPCDPRSWALGLGDIEVF
jgi:GNAT superfamily N-acetyltransferase